ncbi:helix-turn-helix domain-containing protein [Ornithinimicrobium sp. Y1694]|uniref:AraC family transcriptional regulator n=1 Tax=Ornithinimicrobium sp. Y1694 TaxID=3418590 RepID=UPI003CECB0C6
MLVECERWPAKDERGGPGGGGPCPVEELLLDAFGGMRVAPQENASGVLRLESNAVGELRLDRVTVGMRPDADMDPVGAYSFNIVRKGRLRCSTGGESRLYLAGEVCLSAQAEESLQVEHHDTVVDAVRLPQSLLQEVAGSAEDPAKDPSPVRFTSYDTIDRAAARRWADAFTTIRAGSPDGIAHPLVTAATARLLAALALTTIPNTAVSSPAPAQERDAHASTLRRAVAYPEEHAHRDVGLAEVARAARVSPRAVQLAFRKHLDTTPSAHLRELRLRRVREDLLLADPTRTTVAAVAARWGFINASKFAARYREAFDELPSTTLRR